MRRRDSSVVKTNGVFLQAFYRRRILSRRSSSPQTGQRPTFLQPIVWLFFGGISNKVRDFIYSPQTGRRPDAAAGISDKVRDLSSSPQTDQTPTLPWPIVWLFFGNVSDKGSRVGRFKRPDSGGESLIWMIFPVPHRLVKHRRFCSQWSGCDSELSPARS